MNTLLELLQERKSALAIIDPLKDLLNENGWSQDGAYDSKNCLLTAASTLTDNRGTKDALYNAMVEDPLLRERVTYDRMKFDSTMVIEFNDHTHTTFDDIVGLLDRTKVWLERSVRA